MKIEGERQPARPVYWAIQYTDPASGKLVSTRLSESKSTDPAAATRSAFGVTNASDSFTAYNLGTTIAGARKKIRELAL